MPVKRPMCLICLIFFLVIYAYTLDSGPAPAWDVDALSGRTVTVSGVVKERQIKNGTLHIFLSDVRFHKSDGSTADKTDFPDNSKGLIIKTADTGADAYAKLGAVIKAKGVFEPFDKARCEGQFDMREYYMIRGYEGRLERARLLGASKSYGHVREGLRSLRDRAFGVLTDNMGEDDASLVAAMTLGDKSALEPQIKELYQRAGISHVLALSGLHIASVGLALLKLLKKTGLPSPVPAVISAVLIASYAVMTGLSTSTVRAMIMFALFVLSGMTGRTYDLLSAAALSAILILADDIYYIYDSGFLLSFGAVLGIAVVYPVFTGIHKKGGRLYKSLCVTLSITIVTLPVMADSFMQISLCSFVVNLIVIPLMGPVLLTGFSGMAAGLFGIEPAIILKITHYILWLYEYLSKKFEKIDGNILIIGKPERWQTITYATIVILAVNMRNIEKLNNAIAIMKRKNVDRRGRRFAVDNGSDRIKNSHKITYIIESAFDDKKRRTKNILISMITLVMFCAAFLIIMLHPRHEMEIRNVDVGQGDCGFIWGEDIPVIMIDGGSSDISLAGKYRIEPVLKANRISSVDYCFVSHMDSDHVNAVIEMLEDEGSGIYIKNVVVSAVAVKNGFSSENYSRLIKAAEKRGTKVKAMSAGECIRFGKLTLECISPDRPGPAPASGKALPEDENDASLVLVAEYRTDDEKKGFTAVFTGDIGSEAEERILSRLRDCEYLKVAHHGSRFSSSNAFLKATSPEISVISAGVDNRYGHPHDETLQRLSAAATRVYRTDDRGEVIVTYDRQKVAIRCVFQEEK